MIIVISNWVLSPFILQDNLISNFTFVYVCMYFVKFNLFQFQKWMEKEIFKVFLIFYLYNNETKLLSCTKINFVSLYFWVLFLFFFYSVINFLSFIKWEINVLLKKSSFFFLIYIHTFINFNAGNDGVILMVIYNLSDGGEGGENKHVKGRDRWIEVLIIRNSL